MRHWTRIRSSVRPRGTGLACAALSLAAVGLVGSAWRQAIGCGGTPPPISCGFAYNFAMGGVLTLAAADEPQNVALNTYHFLSLLGTCPPPPFRVTMFVEMQDEVGRPLGPEQIFGPFEIDSFLDNVIVLDVDVPGGPPRQARVRARSELAIIDGRVLEQEATQPLCIVPGTDGVPNLEIVPAGTAADLITPFAPGGPGFAEFEFRNNGLDPYEGVIVVETGNAATLARTIVGPETLTHRPYSIADPVGDAFEVAFGSDYPDGCFPPSDVPPHERIIGTAMKPIQIPAGESIREVIVFNAPAPCGNGKCDNSTIKLIGLAAPGGKVDACAGMVPVVRHDQPASNCPRSGRASMAFRTNRDGNVGVGFRSPDPDQPWQVDATANLGASSFTVNGEPGVAELVGDFLTTFHDQFGRICHDRSFLQPPADPDAIFEIRLRYDVQSRSSGIRTELREIEGMPGAPTGRPDEPLCHGLVDVIPTIEGFDPKTVEYLQQMLVIFVTETFDFIQGEVLEVEVVDRDTGGYTKRLVARVPEGATDEPIIGFTVYSDFRAFVGDVGFPCPGDTNGDFVVDTIDLINVISAWGPCSGCPEDFDGDGVVDTADLVTVLAFWGPCDD